MICNCSRVKCSVASGSSRGSVRRSRTLATAARRSDADALSTSCDRQPSRRDMTAALGLLLAPWTPFASLTPVAAAAAAAAAPPLAPTQPLPLHPTAPGPHAHQLLAELANAEPSSSSPSADPGSTRRIQQQYDGYAPSYDELDDGALSEALGFRDLRAQLLSRAQGQVLEVAVGTGLNLQFYDFTRVQQLTAIDLSEGMLQQARARVRAQLPGSPIELRQADATQLPLPASSYDCVVDTFSLCVIPDPEAALREMARVVRPSGRVLLLEHVRSDNPLLAAYQDVSAGAVAASSKGCVWNQDVPALMRHVGLQPLSVTRYTGGTVALIEAVRSGPGGVPQ